MVFSWVKDARQKIANKSPIGKLAANLPVGFSFPTATAMLASFASAFTQTSRFIRLQIADGAEYAEELLPQSVKGCEKLSGKSQYKIICLSYNAYLQAEELEGLPAQIRIATNQPGIHCLDEHGEIVRCGLITRVDILPSDGGFAKYQLTVKTPLALLKHRKTSRVFQDMTVEEIAQRILSEHCAKNPAIGRILETRFVLRKQYKPRSYCNQYNESDLSFLQRILFEEGMFYRLEHIPGDTPKFRPSRTSLRSYDYKTVKTTEVHADGVPPILGPQHEKDKGISAESTLEDYDAPGLYYGKDWEDLRRYADLRQKAHDRRKIRLRAAGNLRQLRAGESRTDEARFQT